MLKSILQFFSASPKDEPAPHQLEIATAALLSEVVRADSLSDERELAKLRELIRQNFDLTEEDVENIVRVGEKRSEEAVDLVQFTKALNKGMSAQGKEQVMKGLWEIAFADSTLSPDEEYIIRKIADLLYIPHSSFIKTKLDAGSA
ncbi:tellurite resistance TerB family protein [Alteromonas lipolytica]|uniref:Co-chaperone DjlA N-terminal domain-containing protein n=1 Tax=Alteromonas lipolytica TaxID=1856405 RepID=A0A1E8FKS5_9ALTE|nr:TerB family tellurite resistance protein [Alteromonas lipolytica]OFI36043.1 hypothetical protein BFC17_10220 [Alteromonas lipolytica]GGF71436.1 hypothetical protein GCM10011338_24570 [Alteromonas lipolytica]